MGSTTRVCSACKQEKPLDEYPRDRSQSGGFGYSCKACHARKKLERRGTLATHEARAALAAEGKKRCAKCAVVKPREEFRARKDARDGLAPWCRLCMNAAANESMKALWHSPERKAIRAEAAAKRAAEKGAAKTGNERGRAWREKNLEKARAQQSAFYKTPHGRQKHQLQQSKRRAVMKGNAATLTSAEWMRVLDAYGGRCAYCRCEGPMTIDHLVPVMAGGEHVMGNVVPACLSCNSKKNDAPLDVALARLGVDVGEWEAARVLIARLL